MKRIAVLALLLCSCALPGTGDWKKDGASQAEFDRDRGRCQAQAVSIPNAPPAQVDNAINACMHERGWHHASEERTEGQSLGRSKRCGIDASGFFSCSFN